MDITPQLLKDIRLSDSFRGYNKDEVDELIERVGAAIVQLQGRLREAIDRAETAESRAASMGGRSESEDTLRRTLVLAQRTADAAIAEANAEAAQLLADANDHATRTVNEANDHHSRTVNEANEHAARTVSEANERASKLLTDAEAQGAVLRAETEAELRRMAEESRGPLLDDIRELERVRSFLRDDIELLERHLGAQRDRLRTQVGELNRIVEEPSTLRLDPMPATSGVDVGAVLAPREPIATIAPAGVTPLPAFVVAAPPVDSAGEGFDDDLDDEFDDPDDEPYETPVASAPAPSEPNIAEPSWADAPEVGYDAGPPTIAYSGLDPREQREGDQFLDQLRRAVDDETGLDEAAMSDFFSGEVDDHPRTRFGRRR